MQKRCSKILLTLIFLPGCLIAGGVEPSIARAGEPDPRALRRTPVVEVFEKWKDSVVYVTGPVVPPDGRKLEAFFNLPGMKQPEQSVGTGFVVHSSGYIVTNAHAADRVISHEVVLSDGKKHAAELVASIRDEDVALLKIDAGRPLPAVRLAGSGDLLIGETVIVIANPVGLTYTCTTGIVSAVGRETNLLDVKGVTLRNMIQTDAAINPGSSGGPWLNVLGEVIGLTASMKRDSQNIGFAVSVASLRRLLPEMLDAERRHGFLTGVGLGDDDPCRVTAIAPGSPATRAGIQIEDLVMKLADEPTPTVADFHLALIGRKPEETLPVELVRGEEPIVVSLTLGKRDKPDGAALLREKFGLAAEPLDAEKASGMALRDPRGFVITEVSPKHYGNVEHPPAPGDVLARINRVRPRDFDHLGLVLQKIEPGRRVPMVLLRNKNGTATRIDVRFVVPSIP